MMNDKPIAYREPRTEAGRQWLSREVTDAAMREMLREAFDTATLMDIVGRTIRASHGMSVDGSALREQLVETAVLALRRVALAAEPAEPFAWCESCGYAHPIGDPDCIDARLLSETPEAGVSDKPITYNELDVPVIDGFATLPDGRRIASSAQVVRVPCLDAENTERLRAAIPPEAGEEPVPGAKVWIVFEGEYSGRSVAGVYLDHDEAIAAAMPAAIEWRARMVRAYPEKSASWPPVAESNCDVEEYELI